MYTIKAWYAGHVIVHKPAIDNEQGEEIVSEIHKDLKEGNLTLQTCGILMPIKTLCVDVMKNNRLHKMLNLSCS